MTVHESEEAILALVAAFERGTLPPAEWRHSAHLVTALVYVRRHGAEGALARLRAAIPRYNVAAGGEASAYHETITRGWLTIVARFAREHADLPLDHAARLLVEAYGDKRYLARHWSDEVLSSEDARRSFIPPDRAPLEG